MEHKSHVPNHQPVGKFPGQSRPALSFLRPGFDWEIIWASHSEMINRKKDWFSIAMLVYWRPTGGYPGYPLSFLPNLKIITGWWCNNHFEKKIVNGKDDIPYIMEKTCLKPPTSTYLGPFGGCYM